MPPSVGVAVGVVGSDVTTAVPVSVAVGVVGSGWVTTTGVGPDSTYRAMATAAMLRSPMTPAAMRRPRRLPPSLPFEVV